MRTAILDECKLHLTRSVNSPTRNKDSLLRNMTTRCCTWNCTNCRSKNIDPRTGCHVRMHKFPDPYAEKERCQQWIVNAGRLDLTLENIKHKRVCSIHFEPSAYACPTDMSQSSLLPTAIPTIADCPNPPALTTVNRETPFEGDTNCQPPTVTSEAPFERETENQLSAIKQESPFERETDYQLPTIKQESPFETETDDQLPAIKQESPFERETDYQPLTITSEAPFERETDDQLPAIKQESPFERETDYQPPIIEQEASFERQTDYQSSTIKREAPFEKEADYQAPTKQHKEEEANVDHHDVVDSSTLISAEIENEEVTKLKEEIKNLQDQIKKLQQDKYQLIQKLKRAQRKSVVSLFCGGE